VSLDLSMNSFQPHNNNSSSYSCWSVFVIPYNLPPNKCPLMEEMKELWKGVDAYDSHLKCRFNLRAAYFSSIPDYLAYVKFVGWCAHDRLNCPICMDGTNAFRLQHCKKVYLFDCYQRFLPSNHLFKNDTRSFLKGKTVRKGPLKRKLGADIMEMLDDLKESENGVFEDYGENHNWTHKSCL
jgi:hypothetical protein